MNFNNININSETKQETQQILIKIKWRSSCGSGHARPADSLVQHERTATSAIALLFTYRLFNICICILQ